jgi:hypothetical protein
MKRHTLIHICEKYHEYVHFTFGLFSYVVVQSLFPHVSAVPLILIALLSSILPDIDHLFYIFIYGRKHDYSKKIHLHLRERHLSQAIDFCRVNHKSNHAIKSHNLITPLLAFITFYFSATSGHPLWAVFFLAICSHFVFDILEDLLVLGRLNPNWWLKFSH